MEKTENLGLIKESEEEFYNVKTTNDNLDKIDAEVGNKVDKESGKGLSSNDYTDEEKEKLAGIAEGANANVQADWDASDEKSDAFIKNKPAIPVAGATAPKAAGAASAGAAATFSRSDHVHPLQTSVSGSSGSCTGNAASATKATQDGGGNVIADTYAKKSIYGDMTVSMGRESGSTVGDNSFVFGGGKNTASDVNSAVLGGFSNTASGPDSVVFGGSKNTASGFYSATLGGFSNTASGSHSATLGGINNTVSNSYSATLGGYSSSASGFGSATLGGTDNTASNYASASCGKHNKAMTAGGNSNTQVGDVFVIGNGTGSSALSNALRVTYLGDVMGTKAFQSSGADYAEFIKPWADGNLDNEDRIGYFVTVKDGLLYKANEGDYIAGITSGNPSVVGNADEDYYWRYERDEFNRIVMEDAPETIHLTERKPLTQEAQRKDESGNPVFDKDGKPEFEEIPILDEDGNQAYEEIPVCDENGAPVMVETGKIIKNARMKLADDYDPSLQDSYVERKDRKEWDYVGMVGVLPVRDDGTCIPGRYCKCGHDGIATFAETRDFDAYMVIERITENIVSVILK